MSPSAAPPSAPRGTTMGTVMRCSCGTTTAEVRPRSSTSAATGPLRRSTAARSRASRAASSSLGTAAVIFGRVRVATRGDSLGEHGGRDHGRPQPLPVPDGGLGDVARDDDLVAHPPDVLALVVAGVGVEVDAQDGGQHGGGQVLGAGAGAGGGGGRAPRSRRARRRPARGGGGPPPSGRRGGELRGSRGAPPRRPAGRSESSLAPGAGASPARAAHSIDARAARRPC